MVEKQTCQELMKEKNNVSEKLQETEGKQYDSDRLSSLMKSFHTILCD